MNMRRDWRIVCGGAIFSAVLFTVSGGELAAQDYRLMRIASGLAQPTFLQQAPGDPDNILYYSTRITAAPGTGGGFGTINNMGSIWRYDTITREATEIMNLSHRPLAGDLGLNAFAFSPDFNIPGSPGYQKLYVSSSQRQGNGAPIDRVEEYLMTGPNGTVPKNAMGQPAVNRLILQYVHPDNDTQNNHAIAWMGFDPTTANLPVGTAERNYLYIATGDGTNGKAAQSRPEQKANHVAGKMLRVDVDASKPDAYPTGDTTALTRNFAIPPTNPIPLWNSTHGPNEQLVGTTISYTNGTATTTYGPAFGEIYYTALRNSYGAGFDRLTGDWYGGDVGENLREEINFVKAGGYDGSTPPLDFGYRQREGTTAGGGGAQPDTFLTWALSGGGTTIVNSVNPIREAMHQSLNNTAPASNSATNEIRLSSRGSYIGGVVYRGPIEELYGKYVYTDFVHGNAFTLEFDRNTPLASYSGNNFNLNTNPAEGELNVAALGHREVVMNKNLSSLWQSLIVDPTAPEYTAANFGAQYGIGRVVSIVDDLFGNMYIIDFGGNRGDVNFGNDYPNAGNGEIFKLVPYFDLRLTVDRGDGSMTLTNHAGKNVDILGYRVISGKGTINRDDLTPVTDRLDMDGNGDIDPNNDWVILSPAGSKQHFREQSTGTTTTLANGEGFELSPEGGWFKSPYEDLLLEFVLADGNVGLANVVWEGGTGVPWEVGDLNFSGGLLDPGDWEVFKAHHNAIPGGMTAGQAYSMGDLDGDGDNDFFDFRIFQAAYIADNGMAAFLALGQIPEPSTLMLFFGAAGGLSFFRRRRTPVENAEMRLTSRAPRKIDRTGCWPGIAVLGLAACIAAPQRANAVMVHQYTFNNGLVQDLIGNAHGTLVGAGSTISQGMVDLSGASGNYVNLPGSTISINSYVDATFEAWFIWEGGNAWQRVFDFGAIDGTNGLDYIFYTPNGSGNNTRAAITNAGSGSENVANGGVAVSQNTLHHVAVVVDDNANGGLDRMSLYINGQLRGDVALTQPLSGLSNANAFLGRSLYSGDAYFNGKIDEFRIHNNALSAQAVLDSFNAGPVPVPKLELRVNTFSGLVEIVNTSSSPLQFDYYRVTSADGLLSPGPGPDAWNSLDAQNVDATGVGAGQSWDVGGDADEGEVSELYLRGGTTLGMNQSRSLGKLFNPSIRGKRQEGDLVFQYALKGDSNLTTLQATYITPPPLLGDYNDNGVVDAADYVVYRNRKAGIGGTTLVNDAGDDGVTIDDYLYWKAHYGETLESLGVGVAGENVPEPTTGLLLLAGTFAALGDSARRCRRLAA